MLMLITLVAWHGDKVNKWTEQPQHGETVKPIKRGLTASTTLTSNLQCNATVHLGIARDGPGWVEGVRTYLLSLRERAWPPWSGPLEAPRDAVSGARFRSFEPDTDTERTIAFPVFSEAAEKPDRRIHCLPKLQAGAS
ncbi:hypothetical protein NM208_g16538 [Fusarium decemcellulare]|uniref:Uncharacterized protein n=1 Tax=Fusarium decemcellulare TaxID=57161 RepID=A0ACC1RBM2_9HYPO|nr:hypothetical protein NM208_g16538 [Fusarium decemcellulare]